MSNREQLHWEARFGRPAALAAFAAGLLLLAGTGVLLSISDDRSGIEPRPDFLLSIDESPGSLYAATGLQAVAALCMIAVFYYLFRATIARRPELPRWFVYVVVVGPAMYAAAQLLSALSQVDAAQMFAEQDYSFENPDPERLERCPAIRGELGSDCAEELLQDNTSGAAVGLGFAGTVAIAFLFVMVPLRARRAGLITPFMSILGVIAGVLFVLPLLPGVPVVIQAFWLGAIGALFLGNWPGGRGPAWESGEPDPWPSPAEKRGLVTRREDEEPAADAGTPEPAAQAGSAEPGARAGTPEPAAQALPPEPEPAPDRPSSRKRRRKRR